MGGVRACACAQGVFTGERNTGKCPRGSRGGSRQKWRAMKRILSGGKQGRLRIAGAPLPPRARRGECPGPQRRRARPGPGTTPSPPSTRRLQAHPPTPYPPSLSLYLSLSLSLSLSLFLPLTLSSRPFSRAALAGCASTPLSLSPAARGRLGDSETLPPSRPGT